MNKLFENQYLFSQLLSDNRTVIMGFSIISIMLYHQNWFVNGPFNQWVQMLGYIGVEVFLLVSGFGIAHSLCKNDIMTYYRNRFCRLMPACVVYGVLKLICTHIPGMPQSNDFFLCDLFSISHWYIYAIVVYYAIAPLLFKAVNKYGWCILIATSVVSYILICFWQYDAAANYFLKYGRWIVKRLPVFILGITIALKPLNLKPLSYCSLGIMFMLANIICLRYIITVNANPEISTIPARFFASLPDRQVIPDNGRFLLDMLSVLFLCPLFAGLGRVFQKIKMSPIITWFGASSLELYLCHQFIYKLVENNGDNNSARNFFISLIIILIFSVIIKRVAAILRNSIKSAFFVVNI